MTMCRYPMVKMLRRACAVSVWLVALTANAPVLGDSHAAIGAEPRPQPRPEFPVRSQRPKPNPGLGETAQSPRPEASPNLKLGKTPPRQKPNPGFDVAKLERPEPRWRPDPACTSDGGYCITPVRYLHDVCSTIEGVARDNGLDPHFMARLLWRESLFDPYAVSPAGAMGIAQFMPGTARLRGLDDPFNPAKAMQASAAYLSDLKSEFGNVGLAAAAYNGGEARLDRFLDDKGGLPGETRAYVYAITGLPVEKWLDLEPESPARRPSPDDAFHESCMTYAVRAPKLETAPAQYPWAMIYAAHAHSDMAERRAHWYRDRYPDILSDAETDPRRMRLPGRRRSFYAVQVGRETQQDAHRLCDRLRTAGGSCMVLRN